MGQPIIYIFDSKLKNWIEFPSDHDGCGGPPFQEIGAIEIGKRAWFGPVVGGSLCKAQANLKQYEA